LDLLKIQTIFRISRNIPLIYSTFIVENETPSLLKAANEEGLTIFWILLTTCAYKIMELKDIQAAHDTNKPIDNFEKKSEQNELFAKICEKIDRAYER
jgi:hypothetical protein